MKENNKRYALILAGGKGSRLWPISTTNKPKQYLNLYSNNIMINETIKRIESIFEYDNIFVITNIDQKELAERYIDNRIPRENIIFEPMSKNTAMCIFYASIRILEQRGNGTITILSSDHYIDETEKLLNLEKNLHTRIIGQNEAVNSVARAIRRNRAGLKSTKRPPSFIFVGPTGVGKTELAKSLAYEMFGNEDMIIRIDMSEYMESNSTSKLIGSPPGYVGYDDAGQLTEKVKRQPYSIVLFDEIEKAHPDVFNLLLQILDDGRLTDSQGNTVSFENTIIIMTSNVGSNVNINSIGFNSSKTYNKEKIESSLRETFRPEFLNRVDEIVIFDSLTENELIQIVDIMLADTSKALADKNISLIVSDEAKKYLMKKGTDLKYGARPLRRAIQRYVEDELSEKVLRQEINNGNTVKLDLENDELTFTIL